MKAEERPTKLMIDGWLTTGEACRQAGVSAPTLRQWERAGYVQARRYSRRKVLWNAGSLKRWLEHGLNG